MEIKENSNSLRCTKCNIVKHKGEFERYTINIKLFYRRVCTSCENEEFYNSLKLIRAA